MTDIINNINIAIVVKKINSRGLIMMAAGANTKEKAITQTFSFDKEKKVLLFRLKQKAKDNRRTLSEELCIWLENSTENLA